MGPDLDRSMKVAIDASMFTREGGSFGRVGGYLDLPCEPQGGDTVSFIFPINKTVMPLPWFNGLLRVEHRLITPIGAGHDVSVMLEDITVDTISQANALNEYLTIGFGLDVAVWGSAA